MKCIAARCAAPKVSPCSHWVAINIVTSAVVPNIDHLIMPAPAATLIRVTGLILAIIRPEKAKSFSEAIRRSFLVIQNLKGMVDNTNVGDEGGFSPNLENADEAIKLIMKAIEKSGFRSGEDISICLDVAANELN